MPEPTHEYDGIAGEQTDEEASREETAPRHGPARILYDANDLDHARKLAAEKNNGGTV